MLNPEEMKRTSFTNRFNILTPGKSSNPQQDNGEGLTNEAQLRQCGKVR